MHIHNHFRLQEQDDIIYVGELLGFQFQLEFQFQREYKNIVKLDTHFAYYHPTIARILYALKAGRGSKG